MAEQDAAGTEQAGEEKQDELSLRDQLMQAFDDVEAADEDTGGEGAQGEPSRDPATGRFTRPEAGDAPQPEASAAAGDQRPATAGEANAQQAESTPQPAAGDPAKPGEQPGAKPEGQTLELQGRFSEADKKMFAELQTANPRAAQWLLDRHKAMEGDYSRKMANVAELDREYRPIQEMFRPWAPRMSQAGFTPGSLIKAWASVEQELVSGDPARQLAIVRNIVQQYGLDRAMVAHAIGIAPQHVPQMQPNEAPQQQSATTYTTPDGRVVPVVSPDMAPWVQELQGLKNWAAQWQQHQNAQAQIAQQQRSQAAQQEYTRIGNEIEAFRTGTEKDGKSLKHPFFDEVERDMSYLAQIARQRGEKPTLQALYDSAVWSNPATRAKAQAAATAAQQAQAQSAARAKAAQARRAGSSVTGSPATGQTPAGQTPKSAGTLRDDLEAAFDSQQE